MVIGYKTTMSCYAWLYKDGPMPKPNLGLGTLKALHLILLCIPLTIVIAIYIEE